LRPTYLHMLSPQAAWAALAARVALPDPRPEEEVPVEDAAGRVNARPVFAARSSPPYHGAAMDGYAVRAADTWGASDATPVRLARPAAARPIDTGDPLPEGYDAVIKIEDVHEPDEGAIEIVAAAPPWHNVRLTGEDVVTGELVVPQGKRLGAFDVGALLAAGVTRLHVRRRPRVALIASGDELVEPGVETRPGDVVEFNSRVLAALVRDWGGEPVRLPPVVDDPARLEAAVRAAAEAHDVVVLIAGSSAGRDDHTARVFSAAGELLVHGINVMPGKPTAAVVTPAGRPLLGLPGYPVSCAVAADRLLRPLLALLLGAAPAERETLRARVARKLPSKVGHEEVVRVQVGRVGGRWIAAPLPRGAGVITSLSRANALLTVPALAEGIDAGEEVDVELLVPRGEAAQTLVHVGSHDLALDLAGDLLRRRHPGRSLASANVGSQAGLHALARGECHLAGTHLLDPATGDYNTPYVRRALAGRAVALVTLAEREQGLTVLPGNPRAILSFEDLARPDVRFVNRQRGAGTRVLLDARLAGRGISPDAVNGYAREEHTHMAAAVAVASGVADCALTIRAAAAALGLGFVPLEIERYELAALADSLDDPGVAALLETLRSPAFRAAAEALGGYSARDAGAVREIR
jgi:putative molybdopterin biosynthesis protein